MKEIHLFYAPCIGEKPELPEEESSHAVRVLRMKEGDPLLATDGRGFFYHCRLSLAAPKRCRVTIDRRTEQPRLTSGAIHLAVAPTKNLDRMEWLAEKATEIGFDTLSFLNCKNSERHVVKTERIEKIVISAVKQSRKARKPTVAAMMPFDEWLRQPFSGQRFIAHCYAPEELPPEIRQGMPGRRFLLDALSPVGDAQVCIGPEGDFSISEVAAAAAAGFVPVSLGESRLRTETAALVAVHMMHLAKRMPARANLLKISCE